MTSEDVKGKISFREVSLDYGAVEAHQTGNGVAEQAPHGLALNGVSFEIKPGQLAAFVGRAGGGKRCLQRG